jgi:hypothetical protein
VPTVAGFRIDRVNPRRGHFLFAGIAQVAERLICNQHRGGFDSFYRLWDAATDDGRAAAGRPPKLNLFDTNDLRQRNIANFFWIPLKLGLDNADNYSIMGA